ncbi:thioredoxin family protein [Rhodovibrio sodomensis]|uniref:Thioredoxin family protein n=1 Tax=Rhodovibrio sodomensis TaxID=1088 RepID=A0ABS1DBG4_9PROT|nr:thioredoxin family protein [Rhodovibrio sodomensis]MBK1667798.1 thioredoxin family protein [Rhodovibrio sodomensis]
MAAMETPVCEFGWTPADFALEGTDGKTYTLADVAGPNGLLVMFICNHCPYVRAVVDRLVDDVRQLQDAGVGAIAIMSNDTETYPDDSFENMQAFARQHGFTFPYVIDETQQVAKAYGAVCTPDFFGFNKDLELQYRGRLDESRKQAAPNAKRELLEAMTQVARTGQGPRDQIPSMGCSIKWKQAA